MTTAVRTAVGMLRVECPVCGVGLQRSYRAGVEVDVCTICDGVWLDWGELEVLRDIETWWAPHLTAPAEDEFDGGPAKRRQSAGKPRRAWRNGDMVLPD